MLSWIIYLKGNMLHRADCRAELWRINEYNQEILLVLNAPGLLDVLLYLIYAAVNSNGDSAQVV